MELSDFVKKVSSRGRITFGDIKRLQRDLLPNGATTRQQVEAAKQRLQSLSRIRINVACWPRSPNNEIHDRARQIGCPSRISPPNGAINRDQCLDLVSRDRAIRKQVSL